MDTVEKYLFASHVVQFSSSQFLDFTSPFVPEPFQHIRVMLICDPNYVVRIKFNSEAGIEYFEVGYESDNNWVFEYDFKADDFFYG